MGLHALDWVSIGVYLVIMVAIAAFFSRFMKGAKDFFAGGRRTPLALYEYLESEPDTPLKAEILDVFASWLRYVEPLTNLSPFGQLGAFTPDGEKRNIPGRSSVFARSVFARSVFAPSGNSPARIRAKRSRFSSTTRAR